jgi:hypothetical protein
MLVYGSLIAARSGHCCSSSINVEQKMKREMMPIMGKGVYFFPNCCFKIPA